MREWGRDDGRCGCWGRGGKEGRCGGGGIEKDEGEEEEGMSRKRRLKGRGGRKEGEEEIVEKEKGYVKEVAEQKVKETKE